MFLHHSIEKKFNNLLKFNSPLSTFRKEYPIKLLSFFDNAIRWERSVPYSVDCNFFGLLFYTASQIVAVFHFHNNTLISCTFQCKYDISLTNRFVRVHILLISIQLCSFKFPAVPIVQKIF